MYSASALGIKKIFAFEFVVDFLDRSLEFYKQRLGLVETHRSSPEWETQFGSRGVYLRSNDISILVSAPVSAHGYTAEFLKILPPGIRRVVFIVDNLDRTMDFLKSHDATFVHSEKKIDAGNSSHRFVTIATPIGFLEFVFLEIGGDADEIPMFDRVGREARAAPPFKAIDHMTINTRTLYPTANFLEHVMDLRKFWDVSFHTPDHKSGRKGTGLSSKVMWDAASRIKFAVNEPLYPHFNDSQIQTFINRNHAPGIQHIALTVDNIIDTVKTLRSRGVQFLDTPDSYYDLLPARLRDRGIDGIKENLADIKESRILVDGRDGVYLLQIFLKDASLLYNEDKAGPFFYEIIQRSGHEGFGEGNFRALFEAIELQEMQH
jgi:4-hydroxyphenylpyruvate dioxygenase